MPTHEKNRLLNCFDDLKEQSDNTDQELEVDEWSDWEDNELVSNLLKLAIPGNTIPSYSTIIPVKKVQITAVQKSLKNDIKEQSDYINQELEVDEWSDRKDNKLDLNLLRYVIPGNTILKEIPSYSTIVPDKRVELTALQKSIKPPVNDNIDELDIKNQKFSKIEEKARSELDDLFKDMEPVIQKTSRLVIEEAETVPKIVEEKLPEPISIDNTRFEMKIDVAEETDQEEGGWGDSNEDWE